MVLRNLFRRKGAAEREEKLTKEQSVENQREIAEKEEIQQEEVTPGKSGADEAKTSDDESSPNGGGRGLFARLKQGLAKTRSGFVSRVDQVLTRSEIDEDILEELEGLLVQADIGVSTTLYLMDELRTAIKERGLKRADELRPVLAELIGEILTANSGQLALREDSPTVYVVVGVNGAGKTTTIGKLAYRYTQQGKKVLLGAGDTFRAAAIDQLEVWANRAGADMIRHQEGSDPAAVAFDTIQAGRARGADVIIIDTAGRLQNKTNLMKELSKVYRVVERELGRPADEVILTVDATTGQNALSQARVFSEATPVSAVALTKLDSTAKGGIVVAIAHELGLPIKLIGIGEGYNDLRDFVAEDFVDALFATED
ncbi:MAG: signal recognition particle-docking protein FtsY [Firmicutes bacterium]|nr:signal recognition particle-docking protein FtsY [Bacillota bacterium]